MRLPQSGCVECVCFWYRVKTDTSCPFTLWQCVCVCVSKGFFPLGTHSLFLTLQKLNTATDRAAAKNPQLSAPRNTHTSICWSLYAHSLIFFWTFYLSFSWTRCLSLSHSVSVSFSRSYHFTLVVKNMSVLAFLCMGEAIPRSPKHTHTHIHTQSVWTKPTYRDRRLFKGISDRERRPHTHWGTNGRRRRSRRRRRRLLYTSFYGGQSHRFVYRKGFSSLLEHPHPPRGWSSAYAILPQRAVRFFASSYVHIYLVLLFFTKRTYIPSITHNVSKWIANQWRIHSFASSFFLQKTIFSVSTYKQRAPPKVRMAKGLYILDYRSVLSGGCWS